MIDIPPELVQSQYAGAAGRAFIAALPNLVNEFLERWRLRVDGPPMHGMAALVLPVVRPDGTPAVVKFQTLDEETEGEPIALRLWNGNGAVRLLDYDAPTGTMLLERLNSDRMLSSLTDTRQAVLVIAELLARLTSMPAPAGMRRLSDIAHKMLADTPTASRRLADPDQRTIITSCAAALAEVVNEPGNRLLHWDLHVENVLSSTRETWLAIDPKPLSGTPAFELFPTLDNRFEPDEVRWRFDAMTDVLALDREEAGAWTLARVLQNALWDIEARRPLSPDHLEIARRLLGRPDAGSRNS